MLLCIKNIFPSHYKREDPQDELGALKATCNGEFNLP